MIENWVKVDYNNVSQGFKMYHFGKVLNISDFKQSP